MKKSMLGAWIASSAFLKTQRLGFTLRGKRVPVGKNRPRTPELTPEQKVERRRFGLAYSRYGQLKGKKFKGRCNKERAELFGMLWPESYAKVVQFYKDRGRKVEEIWGEGFTAQEIDKALATA